MSGRDEDHPAVEDETIAVPRDETVVADRASRPVSDETVIADRATPQVSDETIMADRAAQHVSDETVIADRAAQHVSDETIMADRATPQVSDETVMADRAEPSAAPGVSPSVSQSSASSTSQSFSGSVAPPVEEPPTGSSSRGPRRVRHDALDPMRRIAPAPWQSEVTSEPGVRPGLPVTYGPRYDSIDGLPADIDEVTRSIGPPPLPLAPPAPVDRSDLPSLAKRARRRNIVTLSSYAGAVVLCIGGLYAVWQLAFG